MNSKQNNQEIAREYFEKGYLLQKSGHLDRAAHFYKRSIEFLPTAQAHTFLGWIYSLKGMYDNAIDECKRAIDIDPDYGNPYNDIGAYLIQCGRFDEAEDWLQKALKASKYENYSYPHINLGRIYEYRGDWDKAMTHYKKAIQENPTYEPARVAFYRLQARYN